MIYVLKLEQDKYYVGNTERPIQERIQEHFNGSGTEWTRKYKPLEVLFTKIGTIDDENKETLILMKKYGYQNVRGGNWCHMKLEYLPTEYELKQQQCCHRCGRMGHFAKSCYAKYHINGEQLDTTLTCFRCGRLGHTTNKCFATYSKDGEKLK